MTPKVVLMSGKKELGIGAIKKKIGPTLKSNDVRKAAIFGSFATGTAKKKPAILTSSSNSASPRDLGSLASSLP